ncbi:MAG TPA: cysteine--tRNA ligase [Nannocystis sp.]
MSTPPLLLYDTLSASKRPLEPLEPGHVRFYLCGPTVYDYSHVGHARSAIVADILVRFLREQGLRVTFVRNVTDVDDKIIRRAQAEGISPGEVADKYLAAYHEDLDALGCLRPDVEPRVTGTIPAIIDLVQRLIDRGLAYPSGGDVYFRVAAFPEYGALSKRSLDDMQAGARVEVSELKENPLDFALWKAAKPGEPAWPSPWGPGRPGWHIECSAMSQVHLGETFDLHGGGRDLIFPHHENEIAQSQGAHGPGTFARMWLHNGFVDFAGEKMSKSLGNFFTIREVTALYPPEALRWFLLGVHYRSGINFDVEAPCPGCAQPLTPEQQSAGTCPACGGRFELAKLRAHVRFPGLEEADERVAYVYDTLARARRALAEAADAPDNTVSEPVAAMLTAFTAALRDDLNTAAAIACLSEPLREVNRLLEVRKRADVRGRTTTLRRFLADFAAISRMLGLFAADPEAYLLARRARKAARLGIDVAEVERKVALRDQARAKKDWKEADRLRAELGSIGVTIRDSAEGSTWTL